MAIFSGITQVLARRRARRRKRTEMSVPSGSGRHRGSRSGARPESPGSGVIGGGGAGPGSPGIGL